MKNIDEVIPIPGEIILVLTNVKTGKKRVMKAKNLITDAGDIYYAQRGAAEAPTNAFGIMELGTTHSGVPAKGQDRSAITAFVASSQKAFDGTYPKANDDDADNTGKAVDVTTYRVSYTTGEANSAGITELILTNVTPGASEPIMTHADLTSFEKTSSDTLKIFVNHNMNGV